MNKHHPNSVLQWRFALGFQLVPAGLMLMLLPFCRESPRWQVSKGRQEEALNNLAWSTPAGSHLFNVLMLTRFTVRKRSPEDPVVVAELAEIIATHEEATAAKSSFRLCDAILPGNRLRFFLAFFIFFCQQWSGQNSINYYARASHAFCVSTT